MLKKIGEFFRIKKIYRTIEYIGSDRETMYTATSSMSTSENQSIAIETLRYLSWKNLCDNTFFPQKCEILMNLSLFLAFKAVNILLGGICTPHLKMYTKNQLVKVK